MTLPSKIRVLIVEDQPAIRRYLQLLVEKDEELSVVGTCATVQEATAAISLHDPNLILLDVSLPDGTGFDVLSLSQPFQFIVIFVTAYQEHALKAIKIGALDYILKPISDEEFEGAMAKAKRTIKGPTGLLVNNNGSLKTGSSSKLVLRSQEFMQIVNLEEIIYCNSHAGYTQFYLTSGRKILTSKYIKEYEELLPAKKFIRPHQSYIVNIDCIDRYHKEGYLLLKDGARIPVSFRRREHIVDFLNRIH